MPEYDRSMPREEGCIEAVVLRESRARLVRSAEAGDIDAILAVERTDPGAQCYVVKLLDVMPGVGKVAGRRLLGRLGVTSFARLADLDATSRRRLRDEIGEHHG